MASSIAFNGRCLLQPLTGVQRYARELTARLSDRMSIVQPSGRWVSGMKGHLWEQAVLPLRVGDALLWSPGNCGPLAVRNQVVTIHDASTLDHPEWFEGTFGKWYRWMLPQLARRVRGIITISNFSKERLLDRLDVPEDKIHVVYNGVGREFRPMKADELTELREFREPFFLYVGSVEPRKNLATLLRAWKKAAINDHKLVIVGEKGRVFGNVDVPDDIPNVVFTGRIDNERLIALYSMALAFVFPSIYEGFGLPPLEAMACGCPCILSDIPPHREVGKDAPLFVPPRSEDDWADALRQAAVWSANERDARKSRALEVAGLFSWQETARETVAILSRMAEARR
jgi:glycosyltransferase involved in cell wall biosynthesis